MSKNSMRWILAGLCSFAIVGTTATASARKSKATWDAEGAKTLEANFRKMGTAWENGDTATLKSLMSANALTWETDNAGRPGAWNTEETLKMNADMMAMMKKMGAKATSKITKLDCRASGLLGICVTESDDTFTMPNMPPVTLKRRASVTAVKEGKDWKFTHYHGSLAQAPDMPKEFMALSYKKAKYMDAPDPSLKGLKVAPIAMNPATQASVALFKGQKGWKQGRHFDVSNSIMTLLEGEVTRTNADGKVEKFGPGSVLYQPANEVYSIEVTRSGVALIMIDGPTQSVMVDKDGKPLKEQAMK